MEKRATVGKLATDLMQKTPDKDAVGDLQEAMQGEDYQKNLLETIETGKKLYGDGVFYVEVITKRERLLTNVIRNYFCPKQACPTPTLDQAVYRIHRNPEAIEFLWVVPCKEGCQFMVDNALMTPQEEKWLLECVLAFCDGRLYTWALQLNNEICTKESVCQKCKPIKSQIKNSTKSQPTLDKTSNAAIVKL